MYVQRQPSSLWCLVLHEVVYAPAKTLPTRPAVSKVREANHRCFVLVIGVALGKLGSAKRRAAEQEGEPGWYGRLRQLAVPRQGVIGPAVSEVV